MLLHYNFPNVTMEISMLEPLLLAILLMLGCRPATSLKHDYNADVAYCYLL